MTLPPLPKKRQTKEADITPKILKWLEANWTTSALVEIKIKGNKPLPHQMTALETVATQPFTHKIRDTGKSPADAFLLINADALLITYLGDNQIEIYNYKTKRATRRRLS